MGATEAGEDRARADGVFSNSEVRPVVAGPLEVPAWWARPCVLHPFKNRWYYFSVYDNIFTSEFVRALALIDEDLKRLCMCQGMVLSEHPCSTLQLLARCLSTSHFGCMLPPQAVPKPPSPAPSTSAGVTPDVSISVEISGPREVGDSARTPGPPSNATGGSVEEDGEWTILCQGKRLPL